MCEGSERDQRNSCHDSVEMNRANDVMRLVSLSTVVTIVNDIQGELITRGGGSSTTRVFHVKVSS